jgi:hypothetical protein
LRRARTEGRPVVARCLNEKLSQLHALERLAQRDSEAIENADKNGGLTGAFMVRLVRLHGLSQALLEAANRCRTPISRRVRLPTTYRVRAFEPPLHAVIDPR